MKQIYHSNRKGEPKTYGSKSSQEVDQEGGRQETRFAVHHRNGRAQGLQEGKGVTEAATETKRKGPGRPRARRRPASISQASRTGEVLDMPVTRNLPSTVTAIDERPLPLGQQINGIGLAPFVFSCAPWNGIESWETYETRNLGLVQSAMRAYSQYALIIAQANQLTPTGFPLSMTA